MVNGHPAKAGKELAVGDTLSIDFGDEGMSVYEVLEVPSGTVPKGKASTLYRRIDKS
jgi:ribosomal 50S subunit-recycling heat shock protein